MLFHRYANPLILIDRMIQSNRLDAFVKGFVEIHNEELEDRTQWEFYLHKVFDMTWTDFINTVKNGKKETQGALSQEELESTVADSLNIINGFCPS